ncbi:MAG: DNA recombination protein RmuC [Muribaculaceae bacterium]|nr:DNA recombination protein RmuC [Muribaculaceae bacterium]
MTGIIIVSVLALAAIVALVMMLLQAREQSARMQEQVRILGEEQQRLKEDSRLVFKDVAQQLLVEQSRSMREANDARMGEIVKPLKENLETLKRSIDGYKMEQVSYAAALKQQIKDLSDMNRNIGQEAKELTLALRGDSKVQGDWGELMLKQILDMSGLQEGVNYETQMTREADGTVLKSEEGSRLRPDVVFVMPDNKRLVIDSKVSLTAYVDYVNADDDTVRNEALKRHIASVKKHVDELAAKKYQQIKDSADFVMMFVPNEPAYMLAMSNDALLWEYAYKRQVVMVSPTHLISVVKLISQLWARDRQSKNAIAIADEAGKMYDKLVGFMADMESVGKAIENAQKAHGDALKKLSEGKGNLVGRAQKVKELGAKATKLLPE